MEPSKLDHHQQERPEQLRSRAVAAPPAAPPAGSNHAWNSNFLLKPEESINSNVARACSVSSIEPEEGYEALLSPLSTSMVNDLGFHWPCGVDTSNYQGQLAKTTEDLSDSFLSLSSIGAVWNPGKQLSPSTSCSSKYEQQGLQDLDVGLLCHMDRPHHSTRGTNHALLSRNAANFGGCAAASQQLGTYNKIVLAPSPSSSSFPTSFSMQELQALDLLASARFSEALRPPSLSDVAFFGEGAACGLNHLPLPTPGSSKELQKISSLLDGVRVGKRANGIPEHKASPPAPKKLRPEPRPSTSPFKVRKEKLGDRVAALQQLVAPFGKTDTASVLTEAVGYIKFLQEQVQTLSMPYLRSSSKSKIRVSNEERDDAMKDLRSRGLCLVPLSYTSYFTGDSGTTWSPSYFRGT